jgi:hypothetical protein
MAKAMMSMYLKAAKAAANVSEIKSKYHRKCINKQLWRKLIEIWLNILQSEENEERKCMYENEM